MFYHENYELSKHDTKKSIRVVLCFLKLLFFIAVTGTIYETEQLASYLDQFELIFKTDPVAELESFNNSNPSIHDFQMRFEALDKYENLIDSQSDHYVVGALYVGLDDFKKKIKGIISNLKQVSCMHKASIHVEISP